VEVEGQTEAAPPAMSSVELCLVMAQAHVLRKCRTEDELSPWEAAPYVDCVAAQPAAPFAVALAAALEQARHERTRTRTRSRALARITALVRSQRLAIGEAPAAAAALRAASAATEADRFASLSASRTLGVFATPMPLAGGVRKELAEQLVANGMVGSALPLLEALEVWESLAACYKALDKVPAAVAAVRKRLAVDEGDARAWLVLGELEGNEALMEHSWEVSGGKFAGAKRALARRAAAREDHEAALAHWRDAQRASTLYTNGWFALGYAALKLERDEEAARAFSRTVQLEMRAGEAWNNLAALHMKAKRTRAAHVALSECVRVREHSWHAWDNLATVATEVRRFRQAANAARRLMELTKGARVNIRALAACVAEVERVVRDPEAVTGGPEAAARAAREAARREAREGAAEEALMASLDDIGLNAAGEEEADVDADDSAYGGEDIVGMAAEAAFAKEPLPTYTEREMGRLVADVQAALADASKASPDGREMYKADGTPLARRGDADESASSTGLMGAVWSLQARLRLTGGDHAGATEFTMRRLRALQAGTKWRSDGNAFEQLAAACCDLAVIRLNAAQEATPEPPPAEEGAAAIGYSCAQAAKDLASVRMQLRGVVKQGKEAFGGTERYARLDELATKVAEAEDAMREKARVGA